MKICTLFYVDDEARSSKLYISELESLFHVRYIRAVKNVEWYRDEIIADGPQLIVQDVMLPHPADPNGALDVSAGINLLEGVSDTIRELRIGVILFSNRIRADLIDEMDGIGLDPSAVEVHSKVQVGFKDLPPIAADFHRRCRSPR